MDKPCLATFSKKKIFGSKFFFKKNKINFFFVFLVVKFIGELFLIKVFPEIIIQLCATTMFIKVFQEFKKDIMMKTFESNLEGIIILYDLGFYHQNFRFFNYFLKLGDFLTKMRTNQKKQTKIQI